MSREDESILSTRVLRWMSVGERLFGMVINNRVLADAMRAEPFSAIRICLSILGRSNTDAGAMEPVFASVAAYHTIFLYTLATDAPQFGFILWGCCAPVTLGRAIKLNKNI